MGSRGARKAGVVITGSGDVLGGVGRVELLKALAKNADLSARHEDGHFGWPGVESRPGRSEITSSPVG